LENVDLLSVHSLGGRKQEQAKSIRYGGVVLRTFYHPSLM